MLPIIGESSAFNLQKEKEIGELFFKKIEKSNVVVNDPMVDFYIDQITKDLLQGLDRRLRDYKVTVIENDAINAFAVPGGYIGLYSGLIFALKNEDQLVAVLSHEISHIVLRHVLQLLEKQGELNTSLLASFFLAIALSQNSDSADNPDIVQATLLTGIASSTQSMINFTRENEYEADRLGLLLMQRAGYSGRGMAEFFSFLEGNSKQSELSSIEYLRTHPVSDNRVAEAMQVDELAKVVATKGFKDFDYFKVYLKFYLGENVDLNILDKSVGRYHSALSFYEKGQLKKAKSIFENDDLLAKESDWVFYSWGKVLLDLKEYKAALEVVNKAIDIYPANRAFLLLKVDVLTQLESNQEALNLLLELKKTGVDQRVVTHLIKVYSVLNLPHFAKEEEADWYYHTGAYGQATRLYKEVLKVELTEQQAKKIRYKISRSEQSKAKSKN